MNPFDLTPASIPFVHASDKAAILQSVIPLAVAKGVASNADTLSATDIAIAAREPLRNANPNPDANYILSLTRYYKLMRPIAEHANDHDVLRATVANPSKWVSENVSLECSSIAGEAVAAAINLAAAKIFSGIGNHYDATRFFSEAEAILQEAATLADSSHLCGFLGPVHLKALALFAQAQSLESTAMCKINQLGAEEIESTELQTALRTLTEASALYDRVFKDLAPTASSSTVVANTALFKSKLLPVLARYAVANAYFNGNRLPNTATECRKASELLTAAQAALELTPDQERMTSELATAIISVQNNLPVAGVDDESQLYDLQRMTEQDFREFKQAYGAPADVLPPWRSDSSQDTAALNELRRIVASKDDEIQALNISLRNAQLELLQVSSGNVLNTEVTQLKTLLEKEHETVKSLQEAAELKDKEVDALNEALKKQEDMVKSLCASISPSASRKNLREPGDATIREADRRDRMIKKLQMQVMSKDIEINELKSSLELANSGMLTSTIGTTTDEVDALRKDIALLQNAIDDKDKEVKRLEDEIRQKDDTMAELRGRTESEIESLQETAASKDQEIVKLETELRNTLQMIEALKGSEADSTDAASILQREKAHLTEKLQEKESVVADLNEALRKKDLTIAELQESAAAQQQKEQETIDFYENLKREQNQVISDLRSSLSAKQATLAVAEETARTLESEVQSLKSEVDAKTLEIESLLAMSTSRANDMDQTVGELQSLRDELLAKEEEIQTLKALIEEKESVISILRTTESENQHKYNSLQETLQKLTEDLQSRDRQIVTLLEEANVAAERQKASQVLHEQLQDQISQQNVTSKDIQEQICITNDAASRTRQLEDTLASKIYDEKVLQAALQRVEDADRDKGRTIENLETELEALRTEPKYQPDDGSGRIKVLEDEIIALNAHISYLTNELSEKERELARLSSDDKLAEAERLRKLLAEQDDEINGLKENLFLLREKGVHDGILDGEPTMIPKSILTAKQEEIDRLKESLESLAIEEPIVIAQAGEPVEDISALKKQLKELEELVANQHVQIECLNIQLANKTRDADAALYDAAVLRRALRIAEDSHRDSERNFNQLEEDAANMKDAYELSLATHVSPIGVLEDELRALSTHNQQLIDVIDEKDGEISRLQASVVDAISTSQVAIVRPDFSDLLTEKDAELERLRTLIDTPPVGQPESDSQRYQDTIGFLKEELAYKDYEIRRMRADSAPSEVVQIVDDSLKQALAQKEDEVARLKSALEELAADTVGQTASEPSTAALEALQREISTKNDEIQKLTAIIDAMPQAQEPQDITDAAELVRILESNLEREKDDTAALRSALHTAQEQNAEQARELDSLRQELDALRRAAAQPAPAAELFAAAPVDEDLLRSLRADNETLMEDVHDKRQDIRDLERRLLQAKDVIEDLKDALVRVEPTELTAIADGDAEDIGRLQDLLENMKQREKELNRFYTDLLKQTQPDQAPAPLTQADFERILTEKDAELERLRTLTFNNTTFFRRELEAKDAEIRRLISGISRSVEELPHDTEYDIAVLKSALTVADDIINDKTQELEELHKLLDGLREKIQAEGTDESALHQTIEMLKNDVARLERCLLERTEELNSFKSMIPQDNIVVNAAQREKEIERFYRNLVGNKDARISQLEALLSTDADDLLKALQMDNQVLAEDVYDKANSLRDVTRKLRDAMETIDRLQSELAHARTEGSEDIRSPEQDSQSDGLQELQRIIQAKDEAISDLRHQLATATDATADTAERIRVLENSLAESSVHGREAPVVSASDDIASLTQKIELLQDEVDEKQNTIEALVGAIKDFNEANASLRQSKIEMEDQVKYMRQALENTQGAMSHMLTSAIGQNSEVAAVLSPQLSAIDATTNMSALDMQQKIKYLTDELNKSRREVDDLKKAFQESGSVGGSSYEIATLRKEINRLNKELDRYRNGSVITPSLIP